MDIQLLALLCYGPKCFGEKFIVNCFLLALLWIFDKKKTTVFSFY